MTEMSNALQFRVVNPEPQDPLAAFHRTGRAAVVSRSATVGRAHALRLAVSVVMTSGQPLVIVDSPAVHHHLRSELARHGVASDVRLIHPRAVSEAVAVVRDCLLFANYAVLSTHTPEGRSLHGLLQEARAGLVTLRPRDLTEEMYRAVRGNVIEVDSRPLASQG